MMFPPPVLLQKPAALLATLRESLAQTRAQKVRSLFVDPASSEYLFSMAANRGGLNKLHVSIVPAPPGWRAGFWAIFHAVQTIEEDHDPVYRLEQRDGAWKVGAEIPEDELHGWSIRSISYQAVISPKKSRLDVRAHVTLSKGAECAVPFRLNQNYRLAGDCLTAGDDEIPEPSEGQIVRAGSLCIVWTTKLPPSLQLSYSAVLPKGQEDEITQNDAVVSAWWLPSLGRLPYTVDATIVTPARWKSRAEGVQTSDRVVGVERTARFQCDLPISFPKIVAGTYREMATETANGERFSIFQLDPTDPTRAKRDLRAMVLAADFYRRRLGPLPFKGYECYDADRYYGIESYSHTILQRGVTHFISHEMGHSYFGGLAPCPYVHDSWNEGVTEYIDSVILHNDEDKSLENGLKTVDIATPLSQMAVPWDLNDATYWRGCYVLKMLEFEIGRVQVLAALKAIASERVGKDTRWDNLRPYFEQAAHQPLDWFWKQWIDAAAFPELRYSARDEKLPDGRWLTTVAVAQKGVETPFRIRAAIRLAGCDVAEDQSVTISGAQGQWRYLSKTRPRNVELIVFPYTLAHLKRVEDLKS